MKRTKTDVTGHTIFKLGRTTSSPTATHRVIAQLKIKDQVHEVTISPSQLTTELSFVSINVVTPYQAQSVSGRVAVFGRANHHGAGLLALLGLSHPSVA